MKATELALGFILPGCPYLGDFCLPRGAPA